MKISNIAALLLIGTTVMIAETIRESEEMLNEPEPSIHYKEVLLYKTEGVVIEGTEVGTNTYYGENAGYTDGGNSNSFFGYSAGYFNTSLGNTFIGAQSGHSNTEGFSNTFIGAYSGTSTTTGTYNTFIGMTSGAYNTIGSSNIFNGNDSGYRNTTGSYNTFSGTGSGLSNTTGSYNTFIGRLSGYTNTTGIRNVFLGSYAGYQETGSNKLYIDNSDTSTPLIYGEFDNDLIRINGNFETTDTITSTWSGSNTEGDGLTNLVVLSANNSEADLESDVGFALRNEREGTQWNFRTHQNGNAFVATIAGTGGPEFTVKNATGDFKNVELYLGNGAKNVGGVWINASSRALKENIKLLSTKEALTAFNKLQPVSYNYKTDKSEKVVGFIAEDVPELVAINSRDGLSSMDMVAVLTKVVAETRAELKAKDSEMETMRAKYDTVLTLQNEKIAKLETMQKRVAQLESILTNLALDTNNASKEKVSMK